MNGDMKKCSAVKLYDPYFFTIRKICFIYGVVRDELVQFK